MDRIFARCFCAIAVLTVLVPTTELRAQSSWRFVGTEDKIALDRSGGSQLHLWTAVDTADSRRRIKVIWAELPRTKYAARVREVKKEGLSKEVYESINGSCDLAINGGFFDHGEPQGLVVADGKPLSPPESRKFGGAFVVAGDKVKIVSVQDLKALMETKPGPEQALQSSPVLLRSGRPDRPSTRDPFWSRSTIGITRDENLFVAVLHGVANESITLAETADILVGLAANGGAAVWDVLALDGGPSSHLYARHTGKHFAGKGPVFVPNIVCFEPR